MADEKNTVPVPEGDTPFVDDTTPDTPVKGGDDDNRAPVDPLMSPEEEAKQEESNEEKEAEGDQ